MASNVPNALLSLLGHASPLKLSTASCAPVRPPAMAIASTHTAVLIVKISEDEGAEEQQDRRGV